MTVHTSVLLLFVLWTHVLHVLTQSYPIIHPSQSIEVEEGQNLEVRCSIGTTEGPPKALYWRGVWKSEEEIHQQWTDNFTRTLVLRNITGKDAGIYQCFYNSSTVQTKKGLSIRVISKLATGARCHSKEFLCETSGVCITMEKRCDKQEDCTDGSDERNCQYAKCLDMFICQNQHCINKTLVCDSLHINHCGDWSDEYCLITDYQFPKTEVINATTNQPNDETQMSWLKTTVYAVIGCTVGTVLLISVIVIIVFRFRMKSSLRSTERALRRYHMTVNSRTQQDNNQNSIEMDPFLSSSATYGNIIVNVNNGVQYIPRSDFSPIGVPPSYSDVEREMNINRGSPPPTYSTIDRNPPREVINFNNYIIHDSSIASACATCLPSLSRDSSILSESELCVQPARPVNNLCSDQQTRVMSNTCSVSVQTTNDDSEAGDGQRAAMSCRCQALSVQNGEIVLRDSNALTEDQESGQSQTPHTECSSCVRVCQLDVQGGAIVLTSQHLNSDPVNRTSEEGQEDNRNDSGLVPPESGPALIQVEGGEIVLRENPPTINSSSQETG
ncbi:uncharacterized protein LOC134239883 [Saccostrea cucullata]|uniref:uncharacterized protein LOC134239883 n=1 Tax=Saccostrea cuccullata TaxID=36930 RepID=UPI002ED0DE66